MPRREQAAADIAGGLIPGRGEAAACQSSPKGSWQQRRRASEQIADGVRISGKDGLEPPGMRRQHMDAPAVRLEHAPDLGVHTRKVGNVLEHIR